MVDRELVGVSQYNYLDGKAHPEIVDHPQKIRATITEFFPIFRNACHLDNVVFDVVITIVGNAPVLLEINPAASSGLSDRCLFQREDLDGTLRYVGDGNDYSWITRIQERKARW